MKSTKRNTTKTIFFMIVLVCLIFSAFMYFSKREDKEKAEVVVEQSEVEKILTKDLEKEYPPTAREVLKFYSRIVKCVHSGELSEDEVTKLGDTLMLLYSKTLLKENPREVYIQSLLEEVSDYKKVGKTVTSYAIDTAENAITWTKDGIDYARLLATFTTKEGASFNKAYEEFVLMKDEQDQWKIVGWRLVEPEDM